MWVTKFCPWVLEIPLFEIANEKLKDYSEDLYKIDRMIENHWTEIESMMEKKLLLKGWVKRLVYWAKWYGLLLRFKVLYLKSNYNMTYRETEENIKQNIAFRLFLWLTDWTQNTPSYVIIKEWNDEFWEEFIREVNEKIVLKELKWKKIIRWNRSRWDTTVVEENVAYPTDSTLMKKGKELLTRWIKKIDKILWNGKKYIEEWVKKWIRALRKNYFNVKKYARRRTEKGKEELKKSYEWMIEVMNETVKKATSTIRKIKRETKRKEKEVKIKLKVEIKKVEAYIEKVKRVIQQTKDRILEWKNVEMGEKVISYCSDKATIIKKWKEWKSVEIGRKLSLVEVEKGIISNWKLLNWNPNDTTILKDELEWLEKAMGKKVKNNARDRWYYDKTNKATLEEEMGIKLHIPKRWKKNKEETEEEKKPIFKKYQRFRAGWEWKISLLKRKYWLRRLRVRGDDSVKNSIWWAIVSENIRILVNNG